MFERIKRWARALKRDTYAVYLAARSPDTPWYVKVLAAAVAAYAFSPIDLIPDFIPVLGYLDDLILVPLGIWLVVSLIPEQAMAEYRARANEAMQRSSSLRSGCLELCCCAVTSCRAGGDRAAQIFFADSIAQVARLAREGNRFARERNGDVQAPLWRTCVIRGALLGLTLA